MKRILLWAMMILIGRALAVGQTEKVLWSFGGVGDGDSPKGEVVFDRAGNMYGTTLFGGGSNCISACGIIYELSPTEAGWSENILYTFCSQSNCADGSIPASGLVWDQLGNLYGTTSGGGQYNGGTVFELSPPLPPNTSWTLTTIWSFGANGTDGVYPVSKLTWDKAGNLYSTTAYGGSGQYACGTVFELSPSSNGWSENVLYTMSEYLEGCDSYSGVAFDPSGHIFVTTYEGGERDCDGTEGCGAIFELSENSDQTWSETMLTQFDYTTGASPAGGVSIDAKGELYGTLSLYGSNCTYCGGMFKMQNVNGNWEFMPYFFNGQDGGEPGAGLRIDYASRTAYGTTLAGGTGAYCGYDYGCGTIFSFANGAASVLYNFCSQPSCVDGYDPQSRVTANGRNALYGTTLYGGTYNKGVVFEITP